MTVGSDTQPVQAGDFVEIPANEAHHLVNEQEAPLLWAALWWK